MCAKIRIYMTSCLSFLLIGCVSPPMYFYETEKISLTVEARPDSSQPVQGSLGIKQRLALIAPKKNQNDSSKGVGEAVSALSSFSFKIMPKENNLFDSVLIQTAFVTGEAAAKLDTPEDVAKVASAITLEGGEIENIDKHAECVFNNAVNASTLGFLHVDVYVKDASATIGIQIRDIGANKALETNVFTGFPEGDDKDYRYNLTGFQSGVWKSFNIPLTGDIANQKNNLGALVITGGPNFILDNIYFYKQ